MPECPDCGDPLDGPRDKNEAGHWRDRCLPCIRESTDGVDPDARREPETWLAETEAPVGWDDAE